MHQGPWRPEDVKTEEVEAGREHYQKTGAWVAL